MYEVHEDLLPIFSAVIILSLYSTIKSDRHEVIDVFLDLLNPSGYLTSHSDIVSLADRPGHDSKHEVGLNPVDMGMKTPSITFRLVPLKYLEFSRFS
jgi:hypothetical protein